MFYEIPSHPRYEISKIGIIRNRETKAIKSQYVGSTGYYMVSFSYAGKSKPQRVHRLLGITFIDNPENLPEINHIDGDKLNYKLSNLEWVTHAENMKHAFNTELANNIGNLAQRSLSMINKNNEGLLVDVTGFADEANPLLGATKMQENLAKKMEELAFDEAIGEVIEFASNCNQFLNDKAPWKLKKEGKIDEMNEILSLVANALAIIGVSLAPFLPNLSVKLLGLLNLNEEFKSGELLTAGHKIGETKIVFPRLEDKQ